jgi:hypothetical protein
MEINDRFSALSDEELIEMAQFYGRTLGLMIDDGFDPTKPCNGSVISLRFNTLTQNCHRIETLQHQRIEKEVIDEAWMDYGNDGEDTDKVDTLPDVTLPSLPIPTSPPPPLSQPLPPPSHFPVTIPTTSPLDIITPQPFPPSPNISSQLSQLRLHLPHHHHPLDTVAPPPLPLKPNIVSIWFTVI